MFQIISFFLTKQQLIETVNNNEVLKIFKQNFDFNFKEFNECIYNTLYTFCKKRDINIEILFCNCWW
jgi:hypothetical protein